MLKKNHYSFLLHFDPSELLLPCEYVVNPPDLNGFESFFCKKDYYYFTPSNYISIINLPHNVIF